MSLNSTVARTGGRRLQLISRNVHRPLSTTSRCSAEVSTQTTTASSPDPAMMTTRSTENAEAAGSRTQKLRFELHPFQCFQEARKVLAADRAEKLRLIEVQKERIAAAEAEKPASAAAANEKKTRLIFMRRHLQSLKVQADINDPVIKKRFEDGSGDMNKPIYRHLADQKWRSYDRKLLMQRLTTMHVLPDVFPGIDPRVKVSIAFRRRNVRPGDFVPSVISSVAPSVKLQVYDKGPRYFTIAVVDPDVPDVDADSFANRCHFLATNILVEPNSPEIDLSKLDAEQVILNWLPPTAQRGSPYHRLCTFVFEQPGRVDPMARSEGSETEADIKGHRLDAAELGEKLAATANGSHGARSHGARELAAKFSLRPVGAHLFRTTWDDWMARVMARHGIEGADVELRRRPLEKLPPKKRDTGRYRGFAKLG